MTDQELLQHIVINPKVMVGKPVIRGTRLTVEHILNLLAMVPVWMKSPQNIKGLVQMMSVLAFYLPRSHLKI